MEVDGQALGIKLRKEEMVSFTKTWGLGNDVGDGKTRRFDGNGWEF